MNGDSLMSHFRNSTLVIFNFLDAYVHEVPRKWDNIPCANMQTHC
jgi:hypothetical protein